jgi:hypothetical protein
VVLLLRGEWSQALRVHAFAPVAVLFLALLLAGSVLSHAPRRKFLAIVERFERMTFAPAIALLALLIYWLLRFALDGPQFRSLGT